MLFDPTPVLAGADTFSLALFVDHIVFVVEAGRTSARDVDRALHLLSQGKILGLDLNRHNPTNKDKGRDVQYYPKK